jgi:hypothetical protein
MEEQDIPGILLLIDFEKAFDSISWMFIESVLDFFYFGFSIKRGPPFNYSIREVIINPPNLNNSYYFPFLCGVI